MIVSTHSRPKAAGVWANTQSFTVSSFNTQPPEGGWPFSFVLVRGNPCFNTQPPEGGWALTPESLAWVRVSTHSRLKAAGPSSICPKLAERFQHTAA